ncbi:MAG: hypothetical protein ACT4NV_09865 [Rhodoferax sp.]
MNSEDPQPQPEDGADGDVPDAAGAEVAAGHVVLRPDGYHWLAGDGRKEFGPFSSREEALANMLAAMEEGMEPGESLEEAEHEARREN